MPEVEKILRLVAEGALTAEEADEILAALNAAPREEPTPTAESRGAAQGSARHLRIEVTERGRRVVNLRVPVNIAGWASAFLPGLSDEDSDRIRGAINSGQRGTILDVGDDDDGRVLITSE